MNLWQSLILGVIQGLTEFLPISSSGHLVLTQYLFGIDPPGVTFEVVLHLGTLFAVLVYFRRPLMGMVREMLAFRQSADRENGWKYLLAIGIGSVPAAIGGLMFKDIIEAAFSAPNAAAGFLILTGVFLFCTLLVCDKKRRLSPVRAFVVGLAQAAALMPGVSRSGSTISAAIILGIAPARAAEFSFILSIPAVAGATVLSLGEAAAEGISPSLLGLYLLGGIVAMIVGYASLRLLFGMIQKGRFWWFGVYCCCVGVAWLVFLP